MQGDNKGFTLIELSITIIIIGLVIGGSMIANNLIHSAAIRSVISDLQAYQTGVQTFKMQYDNLPGDMPDAEAYWRSKDADVRNGNGNGLIEFFLGDGHKQEDVQAWKHITASGILPGSYSGDVVFLQPSIPQPAYVNYAKAFVSGVDSLFGVPSANACYYQYSSGDGNSLPQAKHHDDTSYWLVQPSGDENGIIQPPTNTSGNAILVGAVTPQYGSNVGLKVDGTFSPIDIYTIDRKLDDANPVTGVVMAQNGYNQGYQGNPANGTCLNSSDQLNMVSIDKGCMLFFWLEQ